VAKEANYKLVANIGDFGLGKESTMKSKILFRFIKMCDQYQMSQQ
jgi:hypothetical protein